MRLTSVVYPAFDDLYSVQIATEGITHGPHGKSGCCGITGRQCLPHSDAVLFCLCYPVLLLKQVFGIIPTTKKTYDYAWSRCGVGFLAQHRIVKGSPRVLLSPHRRQSGATPALATRHAGGVEVGFSHAQSGAAIENRQFAMVVVFVHWRAGIVSVGTSDYTKAVGIEALVV